MFCPECQAQRRRNQAQIRMLRHGVAALEEWIEAVGPTILAWKADVTNRQEARCKECGAARRLYLAVTDDGELYGLCLEHHEEWIAKRRKTK